MTILWSKTWYFLFSLVSSESEDDNDDDTDDEDKVSDNESNESDNESNESDNDESNQSDNESNEAAKQTVTQVSSTTRTRTRVIKCPARYSLK